MGPLFALTVQQPWVDLILRGEKTIELRQWDIAKEALKCFHEAQGIDPATVESWDISEFGPVILHSAMRIDWRAAALFGYSEPWKLPRGAIVGRTEILRVSELDRDSWYRLVDQHLVVHPLTRRIHAGFLGKVSSLTKPLRFRGKQFFFSVPPSIAHEIDLQLRVSNLWD